MVSLADRTRSWETHPESVCTYTGNTPGGVSERNYYRHRTYDSQLGRFCSRDPVGYLDPRKSYSYVRGRPKTNCGGRPLTARSTASCSRVAPRLRFVPWPRCNHHPVRAASKTTLAERGGYTHTAPRQRRHAQVGRFSANDGRAPVTSDGHPTFGPQAALRRFAGANNMPPKLTGATG